MKTNQQFKAGETVMFTETNGYWRHVSIVSLPDGGPYKGKAIVKGFNDDWSVQKHSVVVELSALSPAGI